jgi:uncharacterized protein (TIGR03437 family)
VAGLLLSAFSVHAQPQLSISPATLPDGLAGSAYGAALQVVNGNGNDVWSISAGQLPPGIGLAIATQSVSNSLTGIPTTPGVYPFTVQVTEDGETTVTQSYSITIAAGSPLTILTGVLPDAVAGSPYSFTIAASGGQPPYSFAATGALPPGLAFSSFGVLSGTPTQPGNFDVAIFVTDSQAGSASKSLALRVSAVGAPGFSVAPQSLSFTGVSGGDAASPRMLTISGETPFSISIQDGNGGPAPVWITATPGSGNAPALVTVTATPGTLPPGSYSALLHFTTSGTAPPADVGVSFTLTAGTPKLETAPGFLRFSARASSPGIQEEEIVVRNSGGGAPVAFQASVAGRSPWLSLSPSSGQSAPNLPAIVEVFANSAGLAAGNYSDTVHIVSAAGTVDIGVSLLVAADGPILRLSETGLHFLERQGAGTSNAESVMVLNAGAPGTTINWTATVAATQDWISVSPASGTATTANPGSIRVVPNTAAAQLPPGAYYALVTVSAPNTQDSPESFSVVLEVLPSTAPAQPELNPGGLLFVVPASGTAPPSQKITVFDSSATPVRFGVSASTRDGAKWLIASSGSGTASTAAPGVVEVSVNPAGLKPGVFTGEVDVNLSGVMRSAAITLLILPTAAEARSAAGCNPTRTVMTPIGLAGNFSLAAGWPETLAVLLTDDCGTPLPDGIGAVVARFDNGDIPLTLHDYQLNGSFTADWTPTFPSANVTITFAASAGALQSSTAKVGGGVSTNALAPPILFDNGTVNNTNPAAGGNVAPGTVAAVYGLNLARATVSPGILPLPTVFSGTTMIVGGISTPLYFLSNGQLNVQIPSELKTNQHYQVAVSVNNAFAVLPSGITVVPATPGVSSFADGRLIAQHSDFTLVDDARPARAGESLVMYLTGMGPTNPPGRDRRAIAQRSRPRSSITQPVVTVDGQPATVLFAGLTPGGIGLYQVNFTVPANARTGDLEVVIKQGDVVANSTKLKVQQ